MKKLINIILVALPVVMVSLSPVLAQTATRDEALRVANNWITLMLQNEDAWGDSKTASVEGIEEFKRGERILGYFCRVRPKGYIIVSLRKELAPVKAYSATDYLNAESKEGLADMLKSDMERALNAIEEQMGTIESATEDEQSILEIDHQPAWNKLEADVQSFKAGLESGAIAMAYDPGTWLISSQWNQRPPYNDDCPDKGCSWPDYNYYNTNARVGCTATAAAQIMRYWSWPPGYDWLNMLDKYIYIYDPAYNPPFKDGNGNQVTQAQIDAVAELCSSLGAASGMIYTCDISTTLTPLPMSVAMETYFAYNAGHVFGATHDMDSWHDFQITQLNANRPVLYGNGGELHTYVVDGWKQADGNLLWHINYGWKRDCDNPNDGCNTWYSRDYPPLTDAMVRDIKPIVSLGNVLSGTYTGNGGYRYFDQDCTNNSLAPIVTFGAGQNLQFLPGVRIKCRDNQGFKIRFEGTTSENTRLFSIKGTQSAGIKIYNGAIELYRGGGLTFLSRQAFTSY